MIRSLIKLGLLVLIGILVYNFFMGTPEEKETSKKVFEKSKQVFVQVKDIAFDVKDLVTSEKQKFDKGKYDAAISSMGAMLEGLKKIAVLNKQTGFLTKIGELMAKKDALQQKVEAGEAKGLENANEKAPDKMRQAAQIAKEMQLLELQINTLTKQMEAEVNAEQAAQ